MSVQNFPDFIRLPIVFVGIELRRAFLSDRIKNLVVIFALGLHVWWQS